MVRETEQAALCSPMGLEAKLSTCRRWLGLVFSPQLIQAKTTNVSTHWLNLLKWSPCLSASSTMMAVEQTSITLTYCFHLKSTVLNCTGLTLRIGGKILAPGGSAFFSQRIKKNTTFKSCRRTALKIQLRWKMTLGSIRS